MALKKVIPILLFSGMFSLSIGLFNNKTYACNFCNDPSVIKGNVVSPPSHGMYYQKKTVVADLLNVRSGPSTSYRIIDGLANKRTAYFIAERNGWSYIGFKSSNGQIKVGWVASRYLRD